VKTKYPMLSRSDREIARLLEDTRNSEWTISQCVRCSLTRVRRVNLAAGVRQPPLPPTAEYICQRVREDHYGRKAMLLIREGCELRWAAKQAGVCADRLRAYCQRHKIPHHLDTSVRFIYALACPVTQQVRYVGAATHPTQRLYGHQSLNAHSKELLEWVEWLRSKDLKPMMIVLEECPAGEWRESELRWIRYCADRGFPLLNKQGANLCKNS